MLSALKRVIAAFLGLIAIVLIIGYFLPREFRVEQSIEIAAPPDRIFPLINRLPNWQLWSPSWDPAKNEHLKIVHSGQIEGVGALRQWEELRGDGKLWITVSEADQKLEYRSEFSTFPAMTSTMTLQPLKDAQGNAKTQLVWTSVGALPKGPFYGWFGFLIKSGLGQQYARDLGLLRELAEKEHAMLDN